MNEQPNSDDVSLIYDGLVKERGPFDTAMSAIARHVAVLLASDKASPSSIETLLGMLPKKAVAEEEYRHVGELSKEEFAELQRLLAIASGREPPTPLPPGHAELWASDLIAPLVAMELAGVGKTREATENEKIKLRSAFETLLSGVGLYHDELYPIESAPFCGRDQHRRERGKPVRRGCASETRRLEAAELLRTGGRYGRDLESDEDERARVGLVLQDGRDLEG
jgi:hypothetical protein